MSCNMFVLSKNVPLYKQSDHYPLVSKCLNTKEVINSDNCSTGCVLMAFWVRVMGKFWSYKSSNLPNALVDYCQQLGIV